MLQKISYLLLLLLFLLSAHVPAKGQQDSIPSPKKAIFILPLVYYTPETRWVFGVGGATNFNLGKTDDTYESQATIGVAYSLRKQFLSYASWRIFTAENKNLFSGEVGWYDYVYFFYGIGNQVNDSDSETYNARFPRLRFDYLRRISTSTYLGVKTGLDKFQFSGFDPDGKLGNGPFIGTEGGLNIGIGPVLILDSRDDSIYPISGWYSENYIQRFGQPWGGDYSYWEVGLDVRNYQTIRPGLVWANQLATKITSGTTPFFALPLLGGNRSLRGLFEGKYRDTNSAFVQTELRKSLGNRWGLVGFAGLGNVFPDLESLAEGTKVTYGAGGRFRLSKAKKLNLRLDLAHSPGESMQFYFTFGEAF
jgi:hypothetical protein